MQNIQRTGELHPFLTKIESKFYPLKNRLNRWELFKGHLKLMALVFIFALVAAILSVFGIMFKPSVFADLEFHVLMIIPALIFARGEYYRFQDCNLAGNIAYKINAAFWMIGAVSIFIKSDTLSNIIVCLALVYLVAVILIPGTKGDNSFGPQSLKSEPSVDSAHHPVA